MKLRSSAKEISRHLLLLVVIFLQACGPGNSDDYYSLRDFSRIKKIDVHAHSMTSNPEFVQQAIKDNFILISINVEVPDLPPVDTQQYYILQLRHHFPKDIYCVSTFETASINEPGWSDRQIARLKRSFDSGALGIKVWKNIGMTIKDKDSNFIMIDNPVFDPIFNYLEQNNIPVIGHIGEPKNCWLPLDQMTTRNDSAYFASHPQYHMYLHPDYPSYDAIIQSRDHLLEKHPHLKFIGAHLGSMEWDVDEIAKRLDRFPNMSVEPAERFGQLQYQSIKNWQKVHDFFIKYQDRLIYATDQTVNGKVPPEAFNKNAREIWLRHWKFFTSDELMRVPKVENEFRGMKLPREVVDKIYRKNAEEWFGLN